MSTEPPIFKSLEEARQAFNLYEQESPPPHEFPGRALATLEALYAERDALLCPPHQGIEYHNAPGCVRCKINQQGEEIADLYKNMQAKVDELVESQVRSVLNPAKLETDKVELAAEIAELLAGADADAHRLGDAAREIAKLQAQIADLQRRHAEIVYLRRSYNLCTEYIITNDLDAVEGELVVTTFAREIDRLKAALAKAPCWQNARVVSIAPRTIAGNWVSGIFGNKECGECEPCKARAAQAKAMEPTT